MRNVIKKGRSLATPPFSKQMLKLVVLFKVFLRAFRIRLHGIASFRPVGRAHFAIFFKVLEAVEHANRFVYVPSQRQVVDQLMLNHAFLVD